MNLKESEAIVLKSGRAYAQWWREERKLMHETLRNEYTFQEVSTLSETSLVHCIHSFIKSILLI